MGGQTHQGGARFCTFYTIFQRFAHENEIIWSQREVQAIPLKPSLSPSLAFCWRCIFLILFKIIQIFIKLKRFNCLEWANHANFIDV